MSNSIGSAKRERSQWLLSPALCAEHLSRGSWKRYPHLDFVSDKIADIENRPIRLIVTMPPRHGKSELISHWTPVWYLKKWPYKRVIITSYQMGYATEWGGTVKNTIVQNEPELELTLATDTRAKARWTIKGYGGGMTATGIGGAITGRGADLIIVDDPIKSQKEAMSITYRESTWEWYRATLRTRLQPRGSIVIVMTRWHDDDLIGRLLGEASKELPYQDQWELINIPAIAGKEDPLGRPEGAVLWPQMFGLSALMAIKEALGSFWWSAEYMGSPRIEGGSIIKEGWFGYFDDDPFAPADNGKKPKTCIQVWDTAYEKSDLASRSACLTLVEGEFLDIVDVWAGRPNFPELQQILKQKYYQYKPERVYVEAKASGKSLVQQIRTDTNIPVIQILDNDDKTTRLHSVSGIVESGKVRLKARAPWQNEFLYEVCGFPAAEHDDITDVFSHALRIMRPFVRDPEPQKIVVYDAMKLVGDIDL